MQKAWRKWARPLAGLEMPICPNVLTERFWAFYSVTCTRLGMDRTGGNEQAQAHPTYNQDTVWTLGMWEQMEDKTAYPWPIQLTRDIGSSDCQPLTNYIIWSFLEKELRKWWRHRQRETLPPTPPQHSSTDLRETGIPAAHFLPTANDNTWCGGHCSSVSEKRPWILRLQV